MQTAQRIIKSYRQRRATVCVLAGIVALILTLAFRFVSERNLNQQRVASFTHHAVVNFDRLLLPLESTREMVSPLVGKPCDGVHLQLRKIAASLQTVRSITLVHDGILYCSSIFGDRHVPVHQLQPSLPAKTTLQVLSTDKSLLKDRPVLIVWFPTAADGQSGVMEVVNIELLSRLMLEPQPPLITRVALSVAGRHLVQGKGLLETLPLADDEKRYQRTSQFFPLSVSVSGPGATRLALQHLPSQLPLALMIGLLTSVITWFTTASRMSFAREINLGLTGREFALFCQPVLHALSLKCVGVEILLRWHNPRQGAISPEVFIPIAEAQHLIAPLTRYVLIEVQAHRHLFPADAHFHIGINAAPSHLRDGELLKDLHRLWFVHHPVQQLIIELTERDALQDVDSRMMRELHHNGVKIAIDDFGTGNSALSWLEKLQPDILKIDKSYTAAIGTDAVNSKVTDIIIALAQRLDIELVAEGVETPQQAQYLRQQGVQSLQGYLFAQPMPIEDFPAWLAGNATPAAHDDRLAPLMTIEDHSSSS
ncbi:EAL domain-containing protein [Kosakonia cowanii]|uniref:EAL domain-containing protein n=1 Tax=Kosakonia cowanii TaxID=208223 RepID=UPI001123D873|nr:EAL domain-containing protein [Kosakonia cowanii]MDP9767007.1 sensor c-di-GMP phosphodiesterase-like protein [Atlantibacter hermannii]TPD64143.1 EAL domain-containing protein [Kosakonia cowanii]TPD88475.1 EAL domain-containing protein [Kosakonia cowanii]TPE04435.1 EAL domain-containing protein [Kosakonia cowanii]